MQSIRNFLKDTGQQKIIDEYELIKELSQKSKKILSDSLFEYLKRTFPNIASTDEVIDVCKAALSLFPNIKADPSEIDGIVSCIK